MTLEMQVLDWTPEFYSATRMSIFYSVRYFVHRTKSVFLHLEMRSGNFFFTTSSTNDSDTRVYEKGKQKTFFLRNERD
jgi:hypothetical protein